MASLKSTMSYSVIIKTKLTFTFQPIICTPHELWLRPFAITSPVDPSTWQALSNHQPLLDYVAAFGGLIQQQKGKDLAPEPAAGCIHILSWHKFHNLKQGDLTIVLYI